MDNKDNDCNHLAWGDGEHIKFSRASVGKESTCNAGDPGSIPGLGTSTGEGIGYPLQCSGLENSTDCIVHGVVKSQTQLSDFHFHRLESCISSRQSIYILPGKYSLSD